MIFPRLTILILLLITAIGCTSQQGLYTVNKHRSKNSTNADPVIYGSLFEYGTKYSAMVSAVALNHQMKPRFDSKSGLYMFSTKPGKHKFNGMAIGYYPTTTKKIKVTKGDSVRIDFYLKVNDTPLLD